MRRPADPADRRQVRLVLDDVPDLDRRTARLLSRGDTSDVSGAVASRAQEGSVGLSRVCVALYITRSGGGSTSGTSAAIASRISSSVLPIHPRPISSDPRTKPPKRIPPPTSFANSHFARSTTVIEEPAGAPTAWRRRWYCS